MIKTKRKEGYRFVWPKIGKEEEAAVVKQLHQSISIYGGGGIFEKFEKEFSKYHNRKFSLVCNSGTSAIHSMFVAADLKTGDEVICPAYTFFATVTPLLFTGAKPILCDCDENGNIDPLEIEKKITKRTKAVVVTHMWGIPAMMSDICAICKKYKLLLLEDCSHAHGARYKGKLVGSFGDISAWSLQGAKLITGGEGGVLTTNNRSFYEKALLLGHYNKRCFNDIRKKSDFYRYAQTGMGLKYRAHPLAIALAYEIFKKFNKYSKFRNQYAKNIIKVLSKVSAVELPSAYNNSDIQPSWYALLFFIKDKCAISKNEFLNKASRSGLFDIDSPNSTKPLNMLPLFNNPGKFFPIYSFGFSEFSYRIGDFPKAENFYRRVIKMPLGIDKDDKKVVDYYKEKIVKILS